LGFEAMASSELDGVLDELIAAHPAEWERYCAGEAKMAGLFTGQVMKATKGRADGRVVAEALEARRA
jgi:aspartyl-tRNA(Asn)/glutamyl-tRNA(Gln) amidotransferase subunit B